MTAAEKSLRENLQRHFVFAGFGLSGISALIYEVVWTRSLSTIMGSTTYALSTMLAAFMAGLSVGGFLGGRISDRLKKPAAAFALCEIGIGLSGIITIPVIKALTPLYIKAFYAYHLSFNTFSAVQFVIIFLIMGIPTTLMGLAFPIVISYFAKGKENVGRQSGHLYCVNTFGAIIGSVISGFLLIPVIGISGAAYTAASLNLLTGLGVLVLAGEKKKLIAAAAAIPVFVTLSSVLKEPDIPIFSYYSAYRFGSHRDVLSKLDEIKRSGESMFVYSREGVEGNVYLTKYGTLINNGKWEAGDEKGFTLLAFLPYLSHPGEAAPKTALNIGLGSGHTLAMLSRFPLEHIDSVELNPDIMDINKRFLNPALFSDPRIKHIQADGRNFLLITKNAYDLIIISPSWAVEASSSEFLTDEFFELAKGSLSPDGSIALWVDYFLMSEDDLNVVLRTFSRHFKYVTDWHVDGDNMVLVGSASPASYSPDEIRRASVMLSPSLQNSFRVAMTERAIAHLPDGEINTDDRPIIEFHNARSIMVGPEKIRKPRGHTGE